LLKIVKNLHIQFYSCIFVKEFIFVNIFNPKTTKNMKTTYQVEFKINGIVTETNLALDQAKQIIKSI